jgi:hypothetical protein
MRLDTPTETGGKDATITGTLGSAPPHGGAPSCCQ